MKTRRSALTDEMCIGKKTKAGHGVPLGQRLHPPKNTQEGVLGKRKKGKEGGAKVFSRPRLKKAATRHSQRERQGPYTAKKKEAYRREKMKRLGKNPIENLKTGRGKTERRSGKRSKVIRRVPEKRWARESHYYPTRRVKGQTTNGAFSKVDRQKERHPRWGGGWGETSATLARKIQTAGRCTKMEDLFFSDKNSKGPF